MGPNAHMGQKVMKNSMIGLNKYVNVGGKNIDKGSLNPLLKKKNNKVYLSPYRKSLY